MNKMKIFTIVLGILNIILGLLFALIIFLMQGFHLALLGILFIIFGIALLNKKVYKKLLFFAIMPVIAWFSLFIIMLGIDKDIPEYAQTPIGVGIIILSPFWLVIIADIFFFNHQKKSILIKQDKTNS